MSLALFYNQASFIDSYIIPLPLSQPKGEFVFLLVFSYVLTASFLLLFSTEMKKGHQAIPESLLNKSCL